MNSSSSSNMTSDSEISPLMANQGLDENTNGNYYFLNKKETISSPNRETPEVEKLPYGATGQEFLSRRINGEETPNVKSKGKSIFSGIFNPLTGPETLNRNLNLNHPNPGLGRGLSFTIGSLMKKRQVAIKIEPKVFFANERTFLAWLHTCVLLTGASIAMVTMSRNNLMDQLYGVVLLPIAIAFTLYAMHQYGKRSQMIRRRAPGPYEDIIGPAVLAVALMLSIVVQFTIKLYSIMEL